LLLRSRSLLRLLTERVSPLLELIAVGKVLLSNRENLTVLRQCAGRCLLPLKRAVERAGDRLVILALKLGQRPKRTVHPVLILCGLRNGCLWGCGLGYLRIRCPRILRLNFLLYAGIFDFF
jgi:hypothetical protein